MYNEQGDAYEFSRIAAEEQELFDLIKEGHNTRSAKREIARRKRKREKEWKKLAKEWGKRN